MTPESILAISAGITLLILWSATILGAAVWLMRQLKELKEEVLADFDLKHQANQARYDALATLVTRHEIILQPEFNGSGTPHIPRHGR